MAINPIITADVLRHICPNIPLSIAVQIADALEFCTPGYKMHDADILAEFIAEIAEESAGFRMRSESLNYSANRLLQVWPSHFKTLKDALLFAGNPVALGNKVYDGRMGNMQADDGYNFRGAGYGMLTGRTIAEHYTDWWGEKDCIEMMERCRNEIWWAVDSACWMFAVEKKLIQLAINDDIIGITKAINGGLIGLTSREAYYKLCIKYIV